MKALQLSLTGLTEEQREVVLNLAEVLKGSKVSGVWGFLVAWDGECLITNTKEQSYSYMYDGSSMHLPPNRITLPISSLKVCPWLCAKYGVGVVFSGTEKGGRMQGKRDISAHIAYLEELRSHGILFSATTTLDLSQFEDNKVAGISIVEVE